MPSELLVSFPDADNLDLEMFSHEITLLRKNAILSLKSNEFNALSTIDILLEYSNALLNIRNNSNPIFENEISIALINVAYYYRDISLDLMQRAYESTDKDMLWGNSGSYLKKGLGYLQYLSIRDCAPYVNVINDLSLEFKLIQQLGIVVLSLSKLRAKIYTESRDAIVDLQLQDVSDLASASVLYSKLVIGCYDTALKCATGIIVNSKSLTYLDGLSFLLLSMDEYKKDNMGIAIGMLEVAIEKFTKLVPATRLNDSILQKKRKRDTIKSVFSKQKLQDKLHKKQPQLIQLLQETLDDFIIPLIILLRYRYQQTNDKLSFSTVIKNEITLRASFPRGKTPDLKGNIYAFQNGKLQELTQSNEKQYF